MWGSSQISPLETGSLYSKLQLHFPLVSKLVTLNDLEEHNDRFLSFVGQLCQSV